MNTLKTDEAVRIAVRAALKSSGVDIWPRPIEDVLTGALVAFLVTDRERSADIILTAARQYGTLDEEQLVKLAEVLADRDTFSIGSPWTEDEDARE